MFCCFKSRDREAEPSNDTGCRGTTIKLPSGRFLKYPTVIGSGAQKTVFRGHDRRTGKSVAWCELKPKFAHKVGRMSFRKEAMLLAKLDHPHILRWHGFWDIDIGTQRDVVMVTELMTSGTLKEFSKRIPKITPKILGNFCHQILSGLQYLHSYKPTIIHRDIKCENIFVTGANAHLKIGDLGAAITEIEIEYPMSIVGTLEFMAPEIFYGMYDKAVDVYAFGMCILEMLTSEYPYLECCSNRKVYKKVIRGIKPQAFGRVLDTDARALIEWCIQTEKKNRPTCNDLINSELIRKLCTSEEFTPDVEHQSPPLDQKLPLDMPSSSAAVVMQRAEHREKALKDLTIDKDIPMIDTFEWTSYGAVKANI